MSKTIEVQILTSEIFVMDSDTGSEIWVPAVPTTPLSVEDNGEVIVPREVHNIIIVKTPASYARLFAGKTFDGPTTISVEDWEREIMARPDDSADVVVRRVTFVGGKPFPAPTLSALAKELGEVTEFYKAAACKDVPQD